MGMKAHEAINRAEAIARPTMPDGHEVTIDNGTLMALIKVAKNDDGQRYTETLERAINAAIAELNDVVRG